jgi:solute carrier family 25 (mitochondrial carnitine/acylcarnitine transporter), member 20/29
VQPFDTIKTRMQSMKLTNRYSGTFHGLTTMVREEGWRSLFRGLVPPLLGTAPLSALMFMAYGNAIRTLDDVMGPDGPDETSHLKITLAGAWGGLLQSFITTPVELFKNRMQMPGSLPVMDLVRAAVRHDGVVRGLLRGIGPTILSDVPSFAAYFWTYEVTKEWLTDWAHGRTLSRVHLEAPSPLAASVSDPLLHERRIKSPVWVLLLSGSFAGVFAWLPSYPIEVIKTVQQTLPVDTPREKLRATAITRAIYQADGFAGFYRGLSPAVIRAIPSNAVTFLVYEWCLESLGQPSRR